MTKKEMFARIATLNFDNDEIVAFCEHEIELLSKKSAGSGKPTKSQMENKGYKEAMLATLRTLTEGVSISELMEQCEGIAGLTNQRVSALMTQLKNDHLVERTTEGKKAVFTIAKDTLPEDDTEGEVQALPEELSV